jgi:hypothetical protein
LWEKLERFAAEKEVAIEFVDLAIDEADIRGFDAGTKLLRARLGEMERWLPTREHKRNTPADRVWPHEFACELDAIEPDDLRALVRWAVEQHLPADQLKVLQTAEASERELIKGLVAEIAPEVEEDES